MFNHTRVSSFSVVRVFLGAAVINVLACYDVQQACYGQLAAQQERAADSTAEDDKKVLRHAVFFKFKDSSSKEDVDRVVDAFRALPAKIKEIREMQLGENIGRPELSGDLTHCFLLTFDGDDGRAVYLPHPDHKAFGGVLRPHLEKVFVIDYWGRPQKAATEKQLKHAAFFKFREDASEEDVQAVEKALADLPSKIDAIRAFEWGKNNSPETHDQGFTHCFMFTFDSEDELREYADHEAHIAAVQVLRPTVEEVRVLDFWAEDVPTSAE
jgi:Stress responsive A/B Barrel Domain